MSQENFPKFIFIKGLSGFLIVLFWINAIADIIIAACFFIGGILEIILSTYNTSLEQIISTQPLIGFPISLIVVAAGASFFMTFLLILICLPIWFYTAYKNLKALRAFKITYSPVWTIFYWFIPILSLFRPPQVARELWIESDPEFEPQMNFISKTANAPSFVTSWWLLYIAGIFVSRLADMMSRTEPKLSLFIFAVAFALLYLSAKNAILIIKGISERQHSRFQRLNEIPLITNL